MSYNSQLGNTTTSVFGLILSLYDDQEHREYNYNWQILNASVNGGLLFNGVAPISGQVLTAEFVGSPPVLQASWQTPSGGGGGVTSVFGSVGVITTLNNPVFTGTVTANAISGSSGTFTIGANGASISIINTGRITVTPAGGTEVALGNTALTSALHDGTDATGTAGQLLSSTGGGTPTTLWITPSYAPLASPGFSGVPTAPTAAPLTNDTQIATTAYVDAATGASKTQTVRLTVGTVATGSVQGPYALNFTTPFADNNYTVQASVVGLEVAPGTLSVSANYPPLAIAYVAYQAAGAGVNVWIANHDSIVHTAYIQITAIHD
jgi:hypothetical protein